MKTTRTKVQWIGLIANDLLDFFLDIRRKIVVTSCEDCPEASHQGVRRVRADMRTSQEEADVIIPQQVSMVTAAGSTC
jgi:hypothetical protein